MKLKFEKEEALNQELNYFWKIWMNVLMQNLISVFFYFEKFTYSIINFSLPSCLETTLGRIINEYLKNSFQTMK